MGDPAPVTIRHDRATPLRYPGGKGKLTPYIRRIIQANGLDGLYAEPYAGGAGIAMSLLLAGDVERIAINDLSQSIYAFWQSVLADTEALCRLIRDTPRTVEAWDRQKIIYRANDTTDALALGFALFFLNRTNRSGILNGGIIGGRDQTGQWKIDARYNTDDLIRRVQAIGKTSQRITLTNLDAITFLDVIKSQSPARSLIYLDPPYYVKGKELYYHFYDHGDHEKVADAVAKLGPCKWIVSYDNVRQIRDIYNGYQRTLYSIGYSARTARQGSEAMFFSDDLIVPPICGPVTVIEETSAKAA
jgi:DNA adenine methylase